MGITGMSALAAPRASTRPVVWRRPQLPSVIHWILRIAIAGCFIGHGAFGIITKAAWLPYFALVGIPESVGYRFMPLIGMMDITIGVLALLLPLRALLVWAVFWTTWTALLRPLTGEGIWEFLERAGNYGIPLALLVSSGWDAPWRAAFTARARTALTRPRAATMAWVLRLTTATLLIGHGGFGAFMHKPGWLHYFGVVGVDAPTVRAFSLIAVVGWCEIALGLAILLRPARGLLLFACGWKVATELLRLPAGEPAWEFVERFGSYAAPLALLVVQSWLARDGRRGGSPYPGGVGASRK